MISGIRVTRLAKSDFGLTDQDFDSDGLLWAPSGLQMHELVSRINLANEALNNPELMVSAGKVGAFIALDAAARDVIDHWSAQYPSGVTMVENPSLLLPGLLVGDVTSNFEVLTNALASLNPAAKAFRSMVHCPAAKADISTMFKLLEDAPNMESDALHTFLMRPFTIAPDDLSAQIDFVVANWAPYLRPELLSFLLRSKDKLTEEVKFGFAGGRPTSEVYTFDYGEPERFSEDKEWMPSVVLIAKNIYVWLHQLSKKYGYEINKLQDIPEQEFEIFAQRGITGLWMIGLWERSDASRRIKQMCGSHDAVASAYSLYDYAIAHQLGGYEGYHQLKDKAWKYGVRLAADMVPNHVGIDSDWVRHHPDRLLSLPHSPFPGYTFNGADLSDADHISVNIEDGYFSQSDAAVVFKRYDHNTGEERFIYHGNDGTSMPWNDTAQIDYANPEAREAVIQKILHVARMFPIIRFDAAMTLVTKHIQRLWFPEPGHGGAIPSRSDYGMTRDELHQRIPKEFWAEVVDRVAEECPDTLLLAEAFWMLEGYFVRSLGMHRVYNSAFMNMLRDEKNDEYRLLMRNTLEFDPQILKRYVNFMNNPDEDTAVDQFGKDDKYFGICTMMVTLPGLPMLGHGQIEGFAEKYGMDFSKPLLDEHEDEGFVRYHEQRVFPLLHKRRLFAEVENFYLFDVNNEHGVEENIFAYSNMRDGERGLVVYHNRFGDSSGWIHRSVGYNDRTHGVVQTDFSDALQLPHGGFARFRDVITGHEFLRSVRDIRDLGFYVQVNAYSCHVFLDWSFVDGAHWAQLNGWLNGRGVDSLDDAMIDMHHEKVFGCIDAWCLHQNPEPIEELWNLKLPLEEDKNQEPKTTDQEPNPIQSAFLLMSLTHDHDEMFDTHALNRGFERIVGFENTLALRLALDLALVEDLEETESWYSLPSLQVALGLHDFEGTTWVNGDRWSNVSETVTTLLPESTEAIEALTDLVVANQHQWP